MAVKAAKDAFGKDEVIDILKRNVALYKGERDFVEYIVNLAIYLIENQSAEEAQVAIQAARASLGPDSDFDGPADEEEPTGRFMMELPTAHEIAAPRPEHVGPPARPVMLDRPGPAKPPAPMPSRPSIPLPPAVAPPTALPSINPPTPLMPSGLVPKLPSPGPGPTQMPSAIPGTPLPPKRPPGAPAGAPPPATAPLGGPSLPPPRQNVSSPQVPRPTLPTLPLPARPTAPPPIPSAGGPRPLTPFGTARGASGAFLRPNTPPPSPEHLTHATPLPAPPPPARPPASMPPMGVEVQRAGLGSSRYDDDDERFTREVPKPPKTPPLSAAAPLRPPAPEPPRTSSPAVPRPPLPGFSQTQAPLSSRQSVAPPAQGPSLGGGPNDPSKMKVYRIVKGTATNTSLDVTICPVCGVNAGRAKACPACGNIFRP